MPHMATRKNRQSIRRLHQARHAKADGQPSKIKIFLGAVLLSVVVLGGLTYSAKRTDEMLEHRAAQPSTEAQAALIRGSLNGSALNEQIDKQSQGL